MCLSTPSFLWTLGPPWTSCPSPNQLNVTLCNLQATQRLRKNAQYFKVNYLIVMLCVTLITLVLNPTSLIALAFLAMAWVYLFVVRQSPIVIAGRTFRYAWHAFHSPFSQHACLHEATCSGAYTSGKLDII